MIDAVVLATAEIPQWQRLCEETTDATMTGLPEVTMTELLEATTIDLLDRTMTDLQGTSTTAGLLAAEVATMIDEEATDQQQADLQQHTTTDEAAAAVLQTTADASETMRTDDPETTLHEALRNREDTSLLAQSLRYTVCRSNNKRIQSHFGLNTINLDLNYYDNPDNSAAPAP